MVYIIGASSLRNTIQGLPYRQKRSLFGSFYHLGGLSFNTRNPIKHEVLQSYLDAGGALERTKKLVIWHDVINNTLAPHKKTEACPISELSSILQKYKTRIEAIVYIQRFGAPRALSQLRSTGIIVIEAFKQLTSHRNRKNATLINDLSQLHPSVKSEARLLFVVWMKRAELDNFGPKQFKKLRQKPKKEQAFKEATTEKETTGSLSKYSVFILSLLDPFLVGRRGLSICTCDNA